MTATAEGSAATDGNEGGGSPSWTPPASQEELDRIINKAVGKYHARYADYDEIKAKAQKHDALELELASETDKQVRAARDEAANNARNEWQPQFIAAKLEAAAARAGVSDDDLASALKFVDTAKFIGADGNLDSAAMAEFIGAIKPASAAVASVKPISFGQGAQPIARQSEREKGKAAAEARFGKK